MRLVAGAALAVVVGTLSPVPAMAHEAPQTGEAAYVMADWMLLSFLVFFGVALAAFVVALKRGLMRDLEAVKYQVLEGSDPDYYTPPSWRTDP